MDDFMYCPKDYYPAICLAFNHIAGGLDIHEWLYVEDMDVWYVSVTDHGVSFDALGLDGKFVRSCFKACKGGSNSWT